MSKSPEELLAQGFGQEVRKRRDALGLSQEKLAVRADVTSSATRWTLPTSTPSRASSAYSPRSVTSTTRWASRSSCRYGEGLSKRGNRYG